MENLYKKMKNTLDHLKILHEVFRDSNNYEPGDMKDFEDYEEHDAKFNAIVQDLKMDEQLYSRKGRQMILADYIEYIFLGRGYYSIRGIEDREKFVRAILHFVNLLMCYESMTVSTKLRTAFLEELAKNIPDVADEDDYAPLLSWAEPVGLGGKQEIDKYFDSLLPKTAGGLWHELLVFAFLLRSKIGYIIPLVLTQRFIGSDGHIVPPDFLILTELKNIYGIEVGIKKEIQSGTFSIQTNIPTATIDTINSRTSDRCPACKRWIMFCDFVIDKYPQFDEEITKSEFRCLTDGCDKYSMDEIAEGKCPNTKYYRNKMITLEHTHHDCVDKHYHYSCVLENVSPDMKKKIIDARDNIALKTHFPYYSGIEALLK